MSEIIKNKTICGVAFNDADYVVQPKFNGKRDICPFYSTWKSMIVRCYSKKHQKRYPTYSKCSVCDEWLIFTKFKKWMEKQDWIGKQLDKDLLFIGNKVYSPDTCVFISKELNLFINDDKSSKGNYLAGVCYRKDNKKFRAQCRNPFTNKQERIGHFNTEIEAHLAWKRVKNKIAFTMASTIDDARISKAVICRYAD